MDDTPEVDTLTKDDLTDLDANIRSSVPDSVDPDSDTDTTEEKRVQPLIISVIIFSTPILAAFFIGQSDASIEGTYYIPIFAIVSVLVFAYGLSAKWKNTKRNYKKRRLIEHSFMLPLFLFVVEHVLLDDTVLLLRDQSLITVSESIIISLLYTASFIGAIFWFFLIPDAEDTHE